MITRDQYINNLLTIGAGKPYRWGSMGDDAFDCSGLVSRCMGFISKKSAQELFEMYKESVISKSLAAPGVLFFYGDALTKISHVMSVLKCWNNGGLTLIGARGGDQTTTSIDKALEQKAFVDIVFGDYWESKFVIACDPFKKTS
jgi:cell wall-associated NlpC family hydrolase